MNKYFYTFGTSAQFPYKCGWVEVHADSWEQAHQKFRARFPDVNPNRLNCAFFYDEAQWNEMEPEKNWAGWKCYEVIEVDIKANIETLKPMQLKQMRFPCPRCGNDNMNEKPVRNALSRYADVYVCDSCGTDEALRDAFDNPLPLSEWSMAKSFLKGE